MKCGITIYQVVNKISTCMMYAIYTYRFTINVKFLLLTGTPDCWINNEYKGFMCMFTFRNKICHEFTLCLLRLFYHFSSLCTCLKSLGWYTSVLTKVHVNRNVHHSVATV